MWVCVCVFIWGDGIGCGLDDMTSVFITRMLHGSLTSLSDRIFSCVTYQS